MQEEQNYFVQELQGTTDYFGTDNTRPPMSAQRASEAGSATGVLLTEDISAETAEVAQSVSSNLEILGSDPTMSQAVANEKQSWKAAILNAGPSVLVEEEDLEEALISIGAAEKSVDMMPERALLNVSAADKLRSPAKDYGFLFDDAMNSAMVDQNMSSMIDSAISQTPIDFDDWLDVFFTAPVTERSFRAEVLEPLGLHEGVSSYAFRAGDEEKVVNWLRSAGTQDEQFERLQMFIDNVTEAEHLLGDNGIFSISFLEQVRDQITYGGSNDAVIDDFFDAFALFDVGAAVKGVKYLASRWLGSASVKTGGFDSGASAGMKDIVQEAADQVVPRSPTLSPIAEAVRNSFSSNRTNKGNLGDLVYMSNPDVIKSIISSGGSDDALRAVGMTADDLASRVSPSQGADTWGMHPSVMTGLSGSVGTRSDFDTVVDAAQRQTLYTPEEQVRGIEREVQKVSNWSQGVLHPQMTEIPDLDDSSDVLRFGAVFGKTSDEGYQTLEEAQEASTFLFSADNFTILGKKKGSPESPKALPDGEIPDGTEFFVRAELDHVLVPMDANPLPSGSIWGSKPFLSYLMPWSSRITNDMFNTASAFTDRTSSVVQQVTESLNPIRKLRGDSEKQDWTKLLMHGDEHSMDWTRPMAEKYLGRMNDRVWDAYQSARKYFDVMHDVRNKKEYLKLSEEGFQSIKGTDGSAFSDRKGSVFGTPVKSLDDSAEVMRTDGTVVPVTDNLIQETLDQGGIVVRTNRDITMDGETYFSHVIVPSRGDVVKLTNHPLTKRKGHVDVMYRQEDPVLKQKFGGHQGGTGYIVTKERSVMLNGKPSTREETVGIFANKPQASEWASKQEGEGFFVKPSREKKAELGIDESVGLTGLPSHSMGRGTRLQGPSGLAEILDPEEAIAATQNEIRRRFGSDYIDLIKSRFMAKYNKVAQRQQGSSGIQYPTSVADIKVRDEVMDMLPELEAEYRFIRNQERGLTGKLTVEWMESHKRANEAMFNKNTYLSRGAARLFNVADPKWLKLGQQVNQITAITGRPIYQTVANSTQAAFMGMRNPVVFWNQTVPRTFSTVMGMAITRGGKENSDEILSLLAKPFGMEVQDFKRYLKQVEDSGVTATGISDDIFSLITDGTKVQAGDFSAASTAFWKKLPSHLVKSANYAPEVATKLSNLMAYVHATNLNMGNNVKDIFKPRIKDKIAGEARKLSYTQNRMDQLEFQQNAWAIPLQFTQHVMKMAWSMMMEPTFKAITGRNIGQQDAAIYARTRAQSVFFTMAMLSTFGIRPIMSDDKAASVANAGLNEEFETLLLDGWLNVGANAIWGEKFDFAHGYSPLSFYSQLADFFFTEDGGINILGPTQMTGRNLFKVYDWARTHHSNPEMSEEDFYGGILHRSTRMFSMMRDIDKATIAYNYGKTVTTSGRPVADIDPSVSMFALFNVPTQKEKLFYEDQGTFATTREFADRVTDAALTEFMREMKDNPDMDGDEIQQLANEVLYKAVYPAIGTENKALYQYAKDRYTSFLFSENSDFLERYGRNLFQMSGSSEEAIDKLRRFAELYPDYQERVDYQIQILEREIENAKGDK